MTLTRRIRHAFGCNPLIYRIYRALTGKAGPRYHLIIRYHGWNKTWSIKTYPGYQSRNLSTLHLAVAALEGIRPRLQKSFKAVAWLGDKPPEWLIVGPHLAYCRSPQDKRTTLIPCHAFWAWPEAGIPNYNKLIQEMLDASKQPCTQRGLFWIGSVSRHVTRELLFELAKSDPRILARSVDWVNETAQAEKSLLATKENNYTTLPDHCRYQYLLDLQGGGYSGRLKILLFSGRPLFIQARVWEEYFSAQLQPFIHYIPVAEDLSDLTARLDWADSHPLETAQIAQAAQEFALQHLTQQAAIAEFEKVFLQLSSAV